MLTCAGDRQLPCPTPLPTRKLCDKPLFHFTVTGSLEYQLSNKSIIHLGRPTFNDEVNNLKWITVSNALLISNAATYTELPRALK